MFLLPLLTRKHLRGLGLSAFHAIALTKLCPIRGKSGSSNLYAIADILQSARAYAQKPRILVSTRGALTSLTQALVQLQNNVVSLPFGRGRSDVTNVVKTLLISKSETNRFKLRALALKGASNHV